MQAAFQRILLKLSGEALIGQYESGIDPEVLSGIAKQICAATASGVQVALVIGGGNLFRGAPLAAAGMDRVRGDQMGMLATVMNGLAMQDCLIQQNQACRVMTAIPMSPVGEPYHPHAARDALQNGEVVICAAGTGNPFFTTDTAASLRAVELHANLMLKATMVDGVYTADPKKDPAAKRYDRLSFDEAIAKRLGVMDLTAMVLCSDNDLPVHVFDIHAKDALLGILNGAKIGTRVEETP